jgi:hypothetical protein
VGTHSRIETQPHLLSTPASLSSLIIFHPCFVSFSRSIGIIVFRGALGDRTHQHQHPARFWYFFSFLCISYLFAQWPRRRETTPSLLSVYLYYQLFFSLQIIWLFFLARARGQACAYVRHNCNRPVFIPYLIMSSGELASSRLQSHGSVMCFSDGRVLRGLPARRIRDCFGSGAVGRQAISGICA